MVRTLTKLQDTIRQQAATITAQSAEIKKLHEQLQEAEEQAEHYRDICNSCQKCQWRM